VEESVRLTFDLLMGINQSKTQVTSPPSFAENDGDDGATPTLPGGTVQNLARTTPHRARPASPQP